MERRCYSGGSRCCVVEWSGYTKSPWENPWKRWTRWSFYKAQEVVDIHNHRLLLSTVQIVVEWVHAHAVFQINHTEIELHCVTGSTWQREGEREGAEREKEGGKEKIKWGKKGGKKRKEGGKKRKKGGKRGQERGHAGKGGRARVFLGNLHYI